MCHEGQVLWSDVDSSTTHTLVDFAQLQDVHALRNKAVSLLELCAGDKAKTNSSKFRVTDSEIEVNIAFCLVA